MPSQVPSTEKDANKIIQARNPGQIPNWQPTGKLLFFGTSYSEPLMAGAGGRNNQTAGRLFLGIGLFLSIDKIESAVAGG